MLFFLLNLCRNKLLLYCCRKSTSCLTLPNRRPQFWVRCLTHVHYSSTFQTLNNRGKHSVRFHGDAVATHLTTMLLAVLRHVDFAFARAFVCVIFRWLQVLGVVQSSLAEYEQLTGRRHGDEAADATALPSSFSGYTMALLEAVAKMSVYVKEVSCCASPTVLFSVSEEEENVSSSDNRTFYRCLKNKNFKRNYVWRYL